MPPDKYDKYKNKRIIKYAKSKINLQPRSKLLQNSQHPKKV